MAQLRARCRSVLIEPSGVSVSRSASRRCCCSSGTASHPARFRDGSTPGTATALPAKKFREMRRNQIRANGVVHKGRPESGASWISGSGADEMPRHQTPAQRETVERVMHEFKHGELKTATGKRKVKNPKQAIAIALHEAGASKYERPAENKRNLRRTKEKERRGETYRDEAEGGSDRGKSARSRSGGGKTKADLYEEAKKRDIPGRSKMNKQQLERALHS
jgi:Family of unknown function (DUF6496)